VADIDRLAAALGDAVAACGSASPAAEGAGAR
jgi:hypothetical protein